MKWVKQIYHRLLLIPKMVLLKKRGLIGFGGNKKVKGIKISTLTDAKQFFIHIVAIKTFGFGYQNWRF